MNEALLREIPSVDSLIGAESGRTLVSRFGRESFLKALRAVLGELRTEILAGKIAAASDALSRERIYARIESRLDENVPSSLGRAVNATGILMHSGLGRAVLPEAAREALTESSRGYCPLALDLETGRRGQRDARIGRLLRELTGAEAAALVNNNAAATVLVLHALARGKEVIVSRGQLVEIGGSFRMPDVMSTSGAILREVGTTNKTHLRDYVEAVGPNTGAILRVHHSNYRIVGFAEEPPIEEIVGAADKHGIPVVDDLGSGALVDLEEYGLETEPLVSRSVAAGVAVACFSGDKLIGGPQSGLIVGKEAFVGRIKKDPLARAFRCGKLTIAAMEATLRLFLRPERLKVEHPLYRMLSLNPDELRRRARRLASRLKKQLPAGVGLSVVDGGSQVGSGSVPVETVPTSLLAVRVSDPGPDELGRRLRLHPPPVFTRISKDSVLFDLRTILPGEDVVVEKALVRCLSHVSE